MKQIKYQLKNKMKVLFIQSKKSPVVSVQMWVKTGSADEKKGEEGISHFIEHLVFKGTDKFKVGEIANLVEASGGELNAYTSFDQTVFYVTISNSFSDVALDTVSQMMGYPTFIPDEIDSEREVVCEEIKMGQDSPGRRSSQVMFSSAFKKHPYGLPVIGYEKNVRSWSAKKIKQFYQSRYVPSNMFLVVSGDFEILEMKQKVQKYFAGFVPYKLKKVKRSQEPKQKKFQFKAEKYKIQDQHLHLTFKAPNVKSKDVPALDILAMTLGQGDSSALVKKLRLENAIVNSISAFNYNPQDQGIFAISAHYQDEKFATVTEEIFKQIDFIQNNPPMWDEIKRARISISSEQFYSIETVDGLASKAGGQEFYLGDANAHKKYLAAVNKITPQDVQKAAKKYLKIDQLSASFLGAADKAASEKKLQTLPAIWKKTVFTKKAALAKQKKVLIPKLTMTAKNNSRDQDVEKIVLKSGIKVLFKQMDDIPTVSSKFVFRGGARLETPETMGLSDLATRSWMSGTKDKNEAELLKSIEELAMGLSPFTGKNTFGFSLDYMTAFEDKALNLALETMTESPFTNEIIAREKSVMVQQIKSKEDHPSTLCVRQFMKSMYGDHPLAYDSVGTLKTLENIGRNEIIQLKEQVLNPENLTISVVGDFNKKEWLNKINQLEKRMTKIGKAPGAHALPPLNEIKKEFLEKDKEQSHVIIGWRGLSLTDPDRFTLQAIQAILAGQGGRLFYELRDKNSLAYSVSPLKMESLETGYFGGYIACSPEKVEKAIDMFQIEFKKLITEKVSIDELDRAKRYLIGQHDIGLQRKSALCNLLVFDEVYGNDYNQSLHVALEYQKVTREKIIQLSESLFTKPYVVSIVGKRL
ncbi:MAG: insulinase family protein [Bdellovibrio sp.]|nr:insulinase family protein [Bdellovibrio sp.]